MAFVRILLIGCLFLNAIAYGQVFKTNKETKALISYATLSGDQPGSLMWSTLAASFNVYLKDIKINISGQLDMQVLHENDGRYTLQMRFHRQDISGNLTFEGFDVDSLLWPEVVVADIEFYNGRHARGSLAVSCFTNGQWANVDVTGFLSHSIGEIDVRAVNEKFAYQQSQPVALKKWIDLVFSYYSFSTLLMELNAKYETFASDSKRSLENLLLDRIEIARLSHLFERWNGFRVLHFDRVDPKKVKALWARISRYEKRATTLSMEHKEGNEPEQSFQVEAFCSALTSLSNYYLSQSKQMQPAQASAWLQMVSIAQSDDEMEIIKTALPIEIVTEIGRCAYRSFVMAGEAEVDKGDYAGALLLLRNATQVVEQLNVGSDRFFQQVYLQAFDGVAGSYLKVGRMALANGNSGLASSYFQKAYDMIDLNESFYLSFEAQDSALPLLFNEIGEIGKMSPVLFLPESGLYHFNVCLPLVEKFGSDCKEVFYVDFSTSCLYLFNLYADTLELMISDGQYPDAANQMAVINSFYLKYKVYLTGKEDRVLMLAEQLFQINLAQSDELLKAQQPRVALDQLLLASEIGNWLPEYARNEINQRLETVSTALITERIEKVRYHIWALRLDEARTLLSETEDIERRYLKGRNTGIVNLIAEVYHELDSRKCLVVQQKVDNGVAEIRTALKNKSYASAVKAFQSIQNILSENAECETNLRLYNAVEPTCLHLVYYLEQFEFLKKQLYNQGYVLFIDGYVELSNFVQTERLDTIGIEMVGLSTFVSSQHLPILTLYTGEYFAEKGQYRKALEFAHMAKKQGASRKESRRLQTQIAAGLAQADKASAKSVDEALDEYVANDHWFSHFKLVYRKNRLL